MSSNKTFFPVIELWSRLCTKHLKYPEKFTSRNVLSTSLLRQYYIFINGTSHLKFKNIHQIKFYVKNHRCRNKISKLNEYFSMILYYHPYFLSQIRFKKTMLNDVKEC